MKYHEWILIQVLNSLQWMSAQGIFHKGMPFCFPINASLESWEAHLETQTAQGLWSPKERAHGVNLELRVVKLFLQWFHTTVEENHILIQSDSMTAVAYLNNQGGKTSLVLHVEAVEIMRWMEQFLLSLQSIPQKRI